MTIDDHSYGKQAAIAAGILAVAGLARWGLQPVLNGELPYFTFFIAIALISWQSSNLVSILSMVVGWLIADLFFVPHSSGLATRLQDPTYVVGTITYFIVALTSIAIADSMRRSKRQAAEIGEQVRITFECIGDAVICSDESGNVSLMNKVAEGLTGWTVQEAMGRPIEEVFKIINESSRSTVENPAHQAIKEGRIVALANHTILISKDGTERPIEDSAAPIRDASGAIVGAVLTFRDISARYEGEKAKSRLAAIVDSSRDAIISKDLNGRIVTWNPGAEDLFGYTAQEAVGQSISMLIPEHLIDEEPKILERIRRGEVIEHYETTRQRKDGSQIKISLSVSPIRDRDGNIIGASKMARDITARINAEGVARENEFRYRTLFESIDEGFCVIEMIYDEQGKPVDYRFIELSPSFEKQTGIVDGQGRTVKEIAPNHEDHWFETYGRIAETGVPERFVNHAKELHRWYDVYAFRFGEPSMRQVAVMFNDITERVNMQDQLADQSRRLAEESKRKDEFLAMLSHELRNPLAPIRSAAHLLQIQGDGNAANPIQKQACEIIERQVGNLTKIVSDLLEVSRVLSGRIRLDLGTVDMAQIAKHAVETSKPHFDQHKHAVALHFCNEPLWTNADATRLEEVFVNLLNNAAKYTPEGGQVEVWCERLVDSNEAQFRIRDNGVGIDAELLPRIFDLFTQADRSLARSAGGLGVGLSLAHRLVELHGGTIEAHSPPPDAATGSEFTVRLPLVEPQALPSTKPNGTLDVAHRPSKVLIIDDNIDFVSMMASTLRGKGYDVETAYNGAEGFQLAEEWEPQVVLLDIGLPEVDGYEVARRIRASENKNLTGARLIALTGYGRDSDFQNSEEAGFDAHAVKPVDFSVLESMMTPVSN